MAAVSDSISSLPLEQLNLYHAQDPLLSSVFIFHGPVQTANAKISSSRIQAHIFAAAGFQSYPRITVSPTAPLYAAVAHLPRDKQGDEVYRGLAVCLFKYFSELLEHVKASLMQPQKSNSRAGKHGTMRRQRAFDENHAADLANRMVKVEIPTPVIRNLKDAFGAHVIPWIDVDLVLPPGSISVPQKSRDSDGTVDLPNESELVDRFGKYAALIKSLGDPVFLPTSKLRRAPSQATHLSKTRLFPATQKQSLRLAMSELVDTEERYVGKLHDLVNNVVGQLREHAAHISTVNRTPEEMGLQQLFPPCLNDILDVNRAFLKQVRQVLEDTENEALADMSSDTSLPGTSRGPSGKKKDPIGTTVFANVLLDWFPRFSKPYSKYMCAHSGGFSLLNEFLQDTNSSFSMRVYEIGEQKLRSLLMEPVQRLPRYSLLIDAMSSNLPSVHPAVKPLLKARDMVTEICFLDSCSPSENSRTLSRLQKMVAGWPSEVSPSGRLVTAADFYELAPPYRSGMSGTRSGSGIVLVYGSCLIMLSKVQENDINSRSLCAQLEKPEPNAVADQSGNPARPNLQFNKVLDIDCIRCTQSKCNQVLHILPVEKLVQAESPSSTPILSSLELDGTYERRADSLIEEIVKAKIEGRFAEEYRDSGKWSLHHPDNTAASLGLLVSVFEQHPNDPHPEISSSNIRVILDNPRGSKSIAVNKSDAEVTATLSSTTQGKYKLDIHPVVGTSSTDTFAAADFALTLSRRLQNVIRPLHQIQNPRLTSTILNYDANVLRAIASQILGYTKAVKVFRPPSPSKLFSSLWNGGHAKYSPITPKSSASTLLISDVPDLRSPTPSSTKLESTQSICSPSKDSVATKAGISVTGSPHDDFKLLEQTFSSYVLAIRSRSGNIVGRVLRSRIHADALAVNELYNALLEDPTKIQGAAEAPVDVLFLAFQTFMNNAWKEKMGPIITPETLSTIQRNFDSMFPGDFEDHFRRCLWQMSPQNRRALTTMIKLLADLLEATGNDGDRGALTAVFADIITAEGNPMECMSLIDRLVEDNDKMFDIIDETATSKATLETTATRDCEKLPSRTHSVQTGSISSAASSLRRRLGFTLSRDGSKSEGEGKVGALIRSLSKSKGSGESQSQPGSFSKATFSLFRSKSTDTDTRPITAMQPLSRDMMGIPRASSREDQSYRPNSAHSNAPTMASIGEDRPIQISNRLQKKRRSSLSDLNLLSTTSITPKIPLNEALNTSVMKSPPASFLPKRQPAVYDRKGQPSARNESPPRGISPSRRNAPGRKENVPLSPRPTLAERPVNRKSNLPGSPQSSPRKRAETQTAVASSKGNGTKERSSLSSNTTELPLSHPRSSLLSQPKVPQKLRMQNPQKLRERVQIEKRVVACAEAELHAELSTIAKEITNGKASPTNKSRPIPVDANSKSLMSPPPVNSTTALNSRLRSFESKMAAMASNFNSRAAALEKDLENSLLVSERRVRKLDQLYREAGVENEALYERFNAELSKISNGFQVGEAEQKLQTQLTEALDELSRVKKENMRLKREVAGLKAQHVSGLATPRQV